MGQRFRQEDRKATRRQDSEKESDKEEEVGRRRAVRSTPAMARPDLQLQPGTATIGRVAWLFSLLEPRFIAYARWWRQAANSDDLFFNVKNRLMGAF